MAHFPKLTEVFKIREAERGSAGSPSSGADVPSHPSVAAAQRQNATRALTSKDFEPKSTQPTGNKKHGWPNKGDRLRSKRLVRPYGHFNHPGIGPGTMAVVSKADNKLGHDGRDSAFFVVNASPGGPIEYDLDDYSDEDFFDQFWGDWEKV